MAQQELMLSILHKAIQKCPNYDPKQFYQLELRKSAIINEALQFQIKECQQQIKKANSILNSPKKLSKQRRKANQISKKYSCSHCAKAYGSEASLNLHNKLKHAYSDSETKYSAKHSQ